MGKATATSSSTSIISEDDGESDGDVRDDNGDEDGHVVNIVGKWLEGNQIQATTKRFYYSGADVPSLVLYDWCRGLDAGVI